jgi:hypothetical protein
MNGDGTRDRSGFDFIQMDSSNGNSQDPISLHKYLYADADPVNLVDPSGFVTTIEGQEIHKAIEDLYEFEHPGNCPASVGIGETGRRRYLLTVPERSFSNVHRTSSFHRGPEAGHFA